MYRLSRYGWLVLLVLVVAGCGTVPTAAPPQNIAQVSSSPATTSDTAATPTSAPLSATTAASTTAADCRTIKQTINDIKGEATVCGLPQRVVALGDHALDLLLTLGVQPVAFAPTAAYTATDTFKPQQVRYLGQFLKNSMVNLEYRNEPNLERLYAIQPDLIVGEFTARREKLYRELSKTAPIIMANQHNWPESLNILGTVLKREDAAATEQENYQQHIARSKAALAPYVAAHPDVLVLAAASEEFPGGIYMSQAPDFLHTIFTSLGFTWLLPDDPALEWSNGGTTISLDHVVKMDPDTIIVVVYGYDGLPSGETTYDVDKLEQLWNSQPQLQELRAAKAGRIHFVDYGLWYNIHGPQSAKMVITELTKRLQP
jgi:iron complex transport system substrate-binding protein